MSRRIPEEDDEEYKSDIYMIHNFFHCCVFILSCASWRLFQELVWLAAQLHQAQAEQKPEACAHYL